MAEANTLTSLNTQFKYVQDKSQDLLPENAVLLGLVPEITEATKEGRKYLVPIQLSHENGVTFGDGSVFALNAASAAVYEEIEVDAQPVILQTQISESVANRMANSSKAFITEATLRARVMYNSLARYLEIAMLYGQSAKGWGTIASITYAGGAATTATFVVTEAQWSSGIWAGAIGAVLEAYNTNTLVSSGSDRLFTVTGVVASTRTIAISGTATGLAALVSALSADATYVLPVSAKANAMIGLDAQITGGAAFFGVDPTVYPLWQGQAKSSVGAISMAKILDGNAMCTAVGGLDVPSVFMCSAKCFNALNTDMAALRRYDSSYSSSKLESGTEGLTFHGPSGSITVMVNNIVKDGEAFLVPPKYLSRVGAKELSFQRPGKTDEFFQEIPGYAGYSLRAGAEFAILLSRPAMACKYSGITYS